MVPAWQWKSKLERMLIHHHNSERETAHATAMEIFLIALEMVATTRVSSFSCS